MKLGMFSRGRPCAVPFDHITKGVNAEGVKPLPYEKWLTAIVKPLPYS